MLLLAVLYARFTYLAPVNHDEVEHAHVGFNITQGQMPYRDFYQNHTPAYWLVTMLTVTAAPFSTNAILLGRAVSALALLGCWLAGLRLLAQMPGGRTCLARLVYTFAVLVTAYGTEFTLARPDGIMTCLISTALCLYPARGSLSPPRALSLGLLAGLAVAVTPKVFLLTLVVPALVLILARHRGEPFLAPILAYALGGFLAMLPLALWVFTNGLTDSFWFDVIALNQAQNKHLYNAFTFFQLPIFPLALLGMLALFLAGWHTPRSQANGPLLLVLWFAMCLPLALISPHNGFYSMQQFTVPFAVGTTCLACRLLVRARGAVFRLILLGALLGYPAVWLGSPLLRVMEFDGFTQAHLQRLIDLARPGNRTCTAFSPWHPIFCRDVSGLSNGWDALFPPNMDAPEQLRRFNDLWSQGVQNTVTHKPDIILAPASESPWQQALAAGMLTREELTILKGLAPEYVSLRLKDVEIWLRSPKVVRE